MIKLKRLMIVILVGLLLMVSGIGFNVSYFSDVAKSQGNTLSTGDFDIDISRDGNRYYDNYKLFSFDNMKPGENRTFEFYIKNRGDYSVSRVSIEFNVSDLERGKLSTVEAEVDDTPNVGELSGEVRILDFRVVSPSGDYKVGSLVGKTLREVNGTSFLIFKGSLHKNEVLKVSVTLQLSPSAGNECLTDEAKVGLSIYAEQ